VVLILAGILGGVGLMIYCAPTAGVTRENYAKIQPGMTEEEVREILGGGRPQPPWEAAQILVGVAFTADGVEGKGVLIFGSGDDWIPTDPAMWIDNVERTWRVESKEMVVVERTWKARLTDWLPW
jgi:hypothetical protein